MLGPNPLPGSAITRPLVAALALVMCGSLGSTFHATAVAAVQSPTTDPLITSADLTYLGSFCLPATGSASYPDNPQSFHDGGQAMAWDPYQGNLIVMGNYRMGNAARVTIPTDLSGCARGTVVGAWLDMMWRLPPDGEDHQIGGFLPLSNGDMIITKYIYYDNSGTTTRTHVRRSAAGAISPYVQVVGTPGQGAFVDGWMLEIPAAWRALLGGPALTGNCCLSIITRTSLGPALAVFDPATIYFGGPTVVPSTRVLAYPYDHPTLGTCETGTTFNCMMQKSSMVWPNGTRALLFPHQVCSGAPFYPGGTWTCPSPSQMVTRMMVFDANDLVAVKNGAKQPWEVLPVSNFSLTGPLAGKPTVAATFDQATQRLYISERYGDGPQPKIHVYAVKGGTAQPAPAPETSFTQPVADTTNPSVTITAPASGSVVTGSVTIGATASDNVAVAGVQFTLDGAYLGGEDTSAPYQATWDTTTVSNGSHTLRAIARDTAGNTASSPVTISVNNVSSLSDSTAPTVALVSPAADTTVTGTTILSATASDNVGVTAVQYTLNDVSLGEPVGAPFQWSWVTSTVPDGAYTLKAVARDAAGNTTQSASRKVTVSNAVIEGSGSGDGIEDGKGGWSDGPRGQRDGDERGRVKPGRGRPANSDLSSDARPLAGADRAPRTSGSTDAPAGAARGSLSRLAGRRDAAASPTDTQAAPAGSALECQGDNPFQSSAGRIGICVGGQWTAVLGIRTWGFVRQRSLPSGAAIWVIETDEALYEVHGGLVEAYRKQDLEILFEGWFRTDLKSPLEGAAVLELRQISVP